MKTCERCGGAGFGPAMLPRDIWRCYCGRIYGQGATCPQCGEQTARVRTAWRHRTCEETDMKTTYRPTGYANYLREGPVTVAQTGERIRSTVPARAIHMAEAGDIEGLRKLAHRSNLRIRRRQSSHYPGGDGWTLSYGSAHLGDIIETGEQEVNYGV